MNIQTETHIPVTWFEHGPMPVQWSCKQTPGIRIEHIGRGRFHILAHRPGIGWNAVDGFSWLDSEGMPPNHDQATMIAGEYFAELVELGHRPDWK